MSKNILSKNYFLKTFMLQFVKKLSLEYTITKSVKTIYIKRVKSHKRAIKNRINAINV